MKRLVVLLLAVWPAFGGLQDPLRVGVGAVQRKLTLQEAVELALANNLEIEIERTNTATASASVRAAQGFFDPALRWAPGIESRSLPAVSMLVAPDGKLAERSVGHNLQFEQRLPWNGASFQLNFENSRQSTTDPFVGLNPYLMSRLDFSFAQPLNRGRAIDSQRTEIRIRRKQLDLSETEFERKTIDIIAQVEQRYWDLVAARQQAAARAEFVEWAREQLARTKRGIETGTVPAVELAAAEAELQRRLDTWYAGVATVTEAENALKQLVVGGAESPLWDEEIVPLDEHSTAPPQVQTLDELVREARRSRPELKVIAAQNDINGVNKQLNSNLLKPQVNLVLAYASAGIGGSVRDTENPITATTAALYERVNRLSSQAGLTQLPPVAFGGLPGAQVGGYGTSLSNLFGGRFPTLRAGLEIEFPFRNRTAEANLARTAIAERRLRFERARLEQAIQVDVRNALQAITTARQRITAAEASVRAAREKLESETRLFETGESTNFLVLTRQNELADSRLRAVVASLDFNRAVARLQQAVGGTLKAYGVTPK